MAAFNQIIMPIGHAFNPDLVLVSAGFDSAKGDPLGGCRVSPSGFAHMTAMLSSLARGRMVVCLEGGYNLRSISRSMEACARVLLGDGPLPTLMSNKPKPRMMQSIYKTLMIHTAYWQEVLYPFLMMKRTLEENQTMKNHLLQKIQNQDKQMSKLMKERNTARSEMAQVEKERRRLLHNQKRQQLLIRQQKVQQEQLRFDEKAAVPGAFTINMSGGRKMLLQSRWAQRRAGQLYRGVGSVGSVGGVGGVGSGSGNGGNRDGGGRKLKRRRSSIEETAENWALLQ